MSIVADAVDIAPPVNTEKENHAQKTFFILHSIYYIMYIIEINGEI